MRTERIGMRITMSTNEKYDKRVIDCFLANQLQLFPEKVAETPEEAREFLEDCFAVVLRSPKEVRKYFKDEFIEAGEGDIMSASEVFAVGDGRYLIVEA